MASSGREQLNGESDKATLLKPGMEQKTLTVSFELSNKSPTIMNPAELCTQKGCGGCTHFCGQFPYELIDENSGAGPSHIVDVASDSPVMCKLCLSEYALCNLYRLSVCRCLFCSECMQQYVQVLVTEGTTTITCPDASCPASGALTEHEVQNLTNDTTFTRYKKLKFERDVELDPQRTFCPQPGCETVCIVPQNDEAIGDVSNAPSQRVDCPTCGHHFCATCKSKWHGDLTCDEVMRSGRHEDEGIPFNAAVDAPIKRCPVCHLPIERNDGCAQMMCKRCKHVFCWYCMASLDNDFLLRHYDKGPCKNRLGHSRASVIWHRTQVIGIFAGFGLLLLVASPFLLLAAPCILCCKCKRCRCHDDDDDTADGANSQT